MDAALTDRYRALQNTGPDEPPAASPHADPGDARRQQCSNVDFGFGGQG